MIVDLTKEPFSNEYIAEKRNGYRKDLSELAEIIKSTRLVCVSINIAAIFVLTVAFGVYYTIPAVLMCILNLVHLYLGCGELDQNENETRQLYNSITYIYFILLLVVAMGAHAVAVSDEVSAMPTLYSLLFYAAMYLPSSYVFDKYISKENIKINIKSLNYIEKEDCGKVLELKLEHELISAYISKLQISCRKLLICEKLAMEKFHADEKERKAAKLLDDNCKKLYLGDMGFESQSL